MSKYYDKKVTCEKCRAKLKARIAVVVNNADKEEHTYCESCYFGNLPSKTNTPRKKPAKKVTKTPKKSGNKAATIRDYLRSNYSNKEEATKDKKAIIDYATTLGFSGRTAATRGVNKGIRKVFN